MLYDELISNVRRILNSEVPSTQDGFKSALKGALRLREPLLSARVEAQATLATKQYQYRMPKDKEFTDFDRKIMLEGNVSGYMATYQILTGLETLLTERILLYSLLLQTAQGSL